MATRRATKTRRLETRAVENGEKAIGYAALKPGFAFTTADDLAFALGFPHLKYVYEDEDDPETVAHQMSRDGYPYVHVAYPRLASLLFLRREFLLPPGAPMTDASIAPGAPMSEEEARLRLAEGIAHNPQPFVVTRYYLFEAFVGPEATAAGLLDGLRSVPTSRWISHPHYSREAIEALSMIALRCTARQREAVITALRDLERRTLEEAGVGFEVDSAKRDLAVSPEQKLGYLYRDNPEGYKSELHRRRALEERIAFVSDRGSGAGFRLIESIVTPPVDVDAIQRADRVADDVSWYALADARLVFLGGENIYRTTLQRWSSVDSSPTPAGEAHQILLDRFGRIRSKQSVELALAMAIRSRAKSHAKQWLSSHLQEIKAWLGEIAASDSELAAEARVWAGKLPS